MSAEDELRHEIRAWLAAEWSPDRTLRHWWRTLADAGWSQPMLPPPFGRSLTGAEARVVTAELAAAGLVAPPQGAIGVNLAIPTVMSHGTADQKERLLTPLIRGEESWCQLFSEPGSGSDLASVGTRAVRDGDGWIVNGQKVWNSAADIARRGLLLARTDVDVPKHEGLSYFVVDMDQPGVDARPLRQMNGESHFCEVFLSDVRVGADDILGAEGDGWNVARVTLAAERATAASRPARGLTFVQSGELAGNLDRTVGDFVAGTDDAPREFTGSAIPARRLVELAQERGVAQVSVIRDGLIRYHTMTTLNRYNQQRARDGAASRRPIPAIANILKLYTSMMCGTSRDLALAILGADALLRGEDAPYGGQIQTVSLASFGAAIGGGTDEIQRNLIAEQGLGLPREPSVDKGVPYRDLKVGTQRTVEG